IGDPLLDGTAQARGGGTRRSRGSGGPAITPSQAFASAERSGPRSPSIALANAEALRRLARLPGTRQELLSLQQVLGNRESLVLTGADATETAVKQADLGRAQIIAFATHGLLAGELDGQSEPGLVLTPPPSPSPTDDGLLTMSEIAALRLNAEWVILSACNTAAGDGSGGAPGLSGIAKSFFLAGAQSLLASHWPVRDDVAARLTVRTIAIATEDPALSRAEALQRAMREIRNDPSADSESDTWAHPNAWAPFTLIGDAR
ncbi:MAG: CHAT domain-containing protein, partial [Alteraurantiacibacter sp.]|nr:CHAT domain-containing protein [Alteraurantiacibacter sp.]